MLPIVAVLSGFGLFFLILLDASELARTATRRRERVAGPHIDATLQLFAGAHCSLARSQRCASSAAWVGWRSAGVTNATPVPPVSREVPRAPDAAPFYASIVLAASGFVLALVAAVADADDADSRRLRRASSKTKSRRCRSAIALLLQSAPSCAW